MSANPTVFVIDDDAAARESVLAVIESNGVAAKGFASAESFLAEYGPILQGCIVVDVRMSGMSGLELLKELKARNCSVPVIVLTGYADVALAVRAMQAGAFSLLQKPCHDDELWQAIRQALEVKNAQNTLAELRQKVQIRAAALTAEEIEVLKRLLEGHPNKRIASDLDLGLRTVELRRSNIMRKMEAASLPDLVRMAILAEFLKPE